MLHTAVASRKSIPVQNLKVDKRGVAPPPIITPAIKPEPHPIFGTIPMGRDGFKLENQTIHMLDFWHRKASAISEEFNRFEGSDETPEWAYFEEMHSIAWEIYRAAIAAKTRSPKEVALQLEIIVRHARLYTGEDCEFLSIDELAVIASNLSRATEPLTPKKHVGALKRGNKLTQAGLLLRYQSFLIHELLTLSLEMYGEQDYALRYVMQDDAVNDRCRGPKRWVHPFFDQNKLSARARSVLKSLKIDTERDDTGSRKPPKVK
jgi:hypothetical protein